MAVVTKKMLLLKYFKVYTYNFISTLGGSMYRSFVDQCYTLACKLGLSGIFSDLERFLY